MLVVANPERQGLVTGLAHPGGNATGISNVLRDTMRAFAWLLVVAGLASALVAFFIAATRPPASPWQLFGVGIGLAVVGIILIARRKSDSDRSVDPALALMGLVLLIAAAVLLGIWIRRDGRRSGARGRR
jgi:drug/metabolite transporter (DMT)-like permease